MTEREYIQRGDQRSVSICLELLRDIVPANNPLILDEEYREVYRRLRAWEERHFGVFNLDADQIPASGAEEPQ